MKKTISIESGIQGVFLKVNGFAIKKIDNGVIVTPCYGTPNMWIATEFVNIQSLRKFWHSYMGIIVSKTTNYHKWDSVQ